MTTPPSTRRFARRPAENPARSEILLDIAGHVPPSRERASADPALRARKIAAHAALATSATAGVLALPPGPLGWVTIAPELYATWRMQRQMVSDIASACGRRDSLGREQMLYCLFGHTAAGAFRDIVIRVGERYLVRRAPLSTLYAIANKIVLRIAQRSASRVVTRWIPALGAAAVAGYVYLDTAKVADTAIALFENEVLVGDVDATGATVVPAGRVRTVRDARRQSAVPMPPGQ